MTRKSGVWGWNNRNIVIDAGGRIGARGDGALPEDGMSAPFHSAPGATLKQRCAGWTSSCCPC